jgi:hypothetical protein
MVGWLLVDRETGRSVHSFAEGLLAEAGKPFGVNKDRETGKLLPSFAEGLLTEVGRPFGVNKFG